MRFVLREQLAVGDHFEHHLTFGLVKNIKHVLVMQRREHRLDKLQEALIIPGRIIELSGLCLSV
ncbi:hypothetical protein D3C81_2105950 [compost metagenome]